MSVNSADAVADKLAQTNINGKTPSLIHPYSASYSRTTIKFILGADDGGKSLVGKTLVVGGWIKSGREQGGGAFYFIQINDGSIFTDIQVYMPKEVAEAHGGKELLKTGASLLVSGTLTETPADVKNLAQAVELKADKVLFFGPCDPKTYPIAKKKHGMEFLREKAHLRPRTNVIGAVARIRSQLAYATHQFFQGHGFLYVHTPIITASDCEGAGEMFQVTTLLAEAERRSAEAAASGADQREAGHSATNDAQAQVAVLLGEAEQRSARQPHHMTANDAQAQAIVVRELKAQIAAHTDADDKASLEAKLQVEVKKLKASKEAAAAEQKPAQYVGGIKRLENGTAIDYSVDFFGRPAYLTVSGQLNGEYYACALSNVYTFGPTFRAEESHTSRHLAEFWMIEPEMAFCTLEDDMQCAEDYVRHCCHHILQHCKADLAFLEQRVDKDVLERLNHVAGTHFKRITYTEAIELLEKAVKEGHKFENSEIVWGMDLGSEHERYICEQVFKQPTAVYNYPKEIKAFYMKLNADGKTVAAMDVLVPGIGELIGGSQREDDLPLLEKRIKETGMTLEPYEGYLDLRRFGGVPHSGFGLGFERLVMFATGMTNIRDVIPFPRYPGSAAY